MLRYARQTSGQAGASRARRHLSHSIVFQEPRLILLSVAVTRDRWKNSLSTMATSTAASATPSPPTTFTQLYATQPDVFQGNYAPLFQPFDDTGGLAHDALFETVVNSSNSCPKVFLANVQINNAPQIIAVHRPSRYEPDLADPAPHWDGKVFGFIGDLSPRGSNFIKTVELPDTSFELTSSQRVPTLATMDARWAADTNASTIAALSSTAADTESVTTRRLFPVPRPYISLILGKTLDPREAWATFSAAISAASHQNMCAPLLDWLRVSCTMKRSTTHPATQLGSLNTVFPPLADDTQLDRHRWSILTRDLPALINNSSGATERVATILGDIRADRVTERAQDEARRTADKRDKLPSETKYKTVARDWMAFTSAATESVLPLIYHQLVNSDKGEHLTILRNAVKVRARSAAAATNQVPVVSKETKEMVLGARFGVEAHQMHDLSQGLQPFSMGLFVGDKLSKTIDARATDYDTMLNGISAPTLGEQASFSTKEVRIPQDHFTAGLMLASTSVQLDVFQGPSHPFATAFREFCKRHWPSIATTIHLASRYNRSLEQTVIPRILRWVQTHMVDYSRELILLGQAATSVPPFSDVHSMVVHQQYNLLPDIPDHYRAALPPAFPTPGLSPPPSKQPSKKESKDTTDSSQQQQKPPGGPARTTGRGGAMVVNHNIDNTWKAKLEQSARKIRDIAPHAPASSNMDDSNKPVPLCLSYHLRGSCYSNCNRAATHRALSQDENSALAALVDNQLSE